MEDVIIGSVEIRTSTGESIGVVGQRWTLDTVPVVLNVLHGVTDMEAVEPEKQPTGRVPEAQWTGMDAQSQPVIVMLWEDVPFDQTVIAQAIAQAIKDGSEAEHGDT